jgi:hypothetical protein
MDCVDGADPAPRETARGAWRAPVALLKGRAPHQRTQRKPQCSALKAAVGERRSVPPSGRGILQAASYFAVLRRSVLGARALNQAMIGVTISGRAYAAIAATLPGGLGTGREIAPDREYLVWLPRAVVNQLRALQEPEETFSAVFLRLTDRGSYAAIMRSTAASGPNT